MRVDVFVASLLEYVIYTYFTITVEQTQLQGEFRVLTMHGVQCMEIKLSYTTANNQSHIHHN